MRTAIIGILGVAASLVSLLNVYLTAGYRGRPPQGSDAVGLVIPFYASFLAAICLIAAALVAGSDGRLSWISSRSAAATSIAVAVAVSISVAIVCSLIAWSEQSGAWVAPFGIFGATLAPPLLALILVLSRAPLDGAVANTPLPRALAAVLVPIAAAGLLVGAGQLAKLSRIIAQRNADQVAADSAAEAKWERMRNRSPVEAAREDMAEMSPSTPLWAVAAGLPDIEDAEAFDIVAKRALMVPKFKEDIAQTIVSQYGRYRHACLLLILHLPPEQRDAAWNRLVAQSIDTTAASITKDQDWFVPSETDNPHPVSHIDAIRKAAALYPGDSGVASALERLKAAINGLPASAVRDSAQQILTTTR